MNGALYIIVIPAVLVAAGYIVVLRLMGMTLGYPALTTAAILFFGTICWLSTRGKRAKSNNQ